MFNIMVRYDEKGRKIIEVGFGKAISVLVAAIITTIVGSAFIALNVANSDHFKLVAVAQELETHDKRMDNFADKQYIDGKFKDMNEKISDWKAETNNKYEDIREDLDTLIKLHLSK